MPPRSKIAYNNIIMDLTYVFIYTRYTYTYACAAYTCAHAQKAVFFNRI
jgi:hypothetical protein